MENTQIRRDAIDALVALGHKRAEATRMVDAGSKSVPGATTAQEIIRAAYTLPPDLRDPQQSTNAAAGPYASAYYAYYTQSSASGPDQELLLIARSVGPGLTLAEFERLGKRVSEVQQKRGQLTNRDYQNALWAIPEAFAAERANPVHFVPARDLAGRPVTEVLVPTPADAVQSLAPPTPIAPVPLEAMESLAGGSSAPAPPQPMPAPSRPSPVSPEALAAVIAKPRPLGIGEPANVATARAGAMNQPGPQQSAGGNSLDQMQAAGDIIGVMDQTGITDLVNAGVSITRALADPGRAGTHLVNAGISAVSAIPLVGDLAKLLKIGGKVPQPPGPKMRSIAGAPPRQSSAPMPSAGGVDATAQAAMAILGMGGGGTGGNQPPDPPGSGGQGGSGGDPESFSGRAGQVGSTLGSLGEAIQSFLNKTGSAGVVLATVGAEVYNRALKPLIDWFKQIDDTSRKMLNDSRRLAALDGGVAATYQQLDVGRFMREQGQAHAMAGPLSRLAGAQNRFEEAQQGLVQPYEKLSADMQAWRTAAAAYMVKLIDRVDFIGNILDWYHQKDTQNPAAARSSAERAFAMLDDIVAHKKVGPNK